MIDCPAPNLDAQDIDDLREFAQYALNNSRACAVHIVGDKRKGYTRIARAFGHYAWNKVTAMQCRTRGDIQNAQLYERICDNIYSEIPDDLKW